MDKDLKTYFEETEGTGVLSTADGNGRVNAAVYARPHILEDGTAAVIMRNRLTRKNLQENPHAAYLFMEKAAGYKGRRLYLTKIDEDADADRINELRRRCPTTDVDPDKAELFLVRFQIDKVIPLVGPGKSSGGRD